MILIEPTNRIYSFKANKLKKEQNQNSENFDNKNKENLVLTLAALAVAGLAAVGLKKTSVLSFEEALAKNGVEIKDGIAKLIKNGENFTGKIERFEKRNRKETVEFVDGKMTEKLYHNLLGKELEGVFYKDGKQVLRIWQGVGQTKNSHGFLYEGNNVPKNEPGPFVETKNGFAWAREYIKNNIK